MLLLHTLQATKVREWRITARTYVCMSECNTPGVSQTPISFPGYVTQQQPLKLQQEGDLILFIRHSHTQSIMERTYLPMLGLNA